jgi:hypothetical protein
MGGGWNWLRIVSNGRQALVLAVLNLPVLLPGLVIALMRNHELVYGISNLLSLCLADRDICIIFMCVSVRNFLLMSFQVFGYF